MGEFLQMFFMKIKLVFLLIFSIFLSCNQNENKKTSGQNLNPANTDFLQNERKADADSAKSILSSEKDVLVFQLKIDSANQHVTVPISVTTGDTLFATLTSKDDKANIRISQIGFPDSTFDGPFGKTIRQKIKDTGNYKIIIGEDMMAGDRWNGDFELKAWVK